MNVYAHMRVSLWEFSYRRETFYVSGLHVGNLVKYILIAHVHVYT